jgi:hypothetical protein
MSGVILLLVLAIGAVTLIGLANLVGASNQQHERAGLFGIERRARRLEIEALDAHLAGDGHGDRVTSLSEMVAVLDRLAFGGVPIESCRTTPSFGWWLVKFRDGTELCVQVGDPRIMVRAGALAAKEPVVVARVDPRADSAVVELAAPRHRPLRVALRA